MTSNTPIGHEQAFLENVNILGVEVSLFDFLMRSLMELPGPYRLRKYRSLSDSQMLESIIPQTRSDHMFAASVDVQIWIWVINVSMSHRIITEFIYPTLSDDSLQFRHVKYR